MVPFHFFNSFIFRKTFLSTKLPKWLSDIPQLVIVQLDYEEITITYNYLLPGYVTNTSKTFTS